MPTTFLRAGTLLLVALASIAGVRTGSVAARDGVRIVYDVRGSGDTTLLFVHCWSCDRSFWKNQVDVFADRYQVVTLDLGGHGESGKNRKSWTVLGLAGDVQAVADELKLKRIILVGHSMGGPVVLEAARLLHGRVIGVVAVDTLHNAEQQITPQMLQPIADKLEADFAGTMGGVMGSMFAKDSDPAVREWVEKKAKAADPAVAVALMRDFANIDLKKLFVSAGVPIRGINAKPPGAPPTNFEGNRKYADYDAVVMDNVGHFIQLERPKEFNEHLTKFAAAFAAGASK
jgi:pimeloyl-ACP methyl ester carboxylesterase